MPFPFTLPTTSSVSLSDFFTSTTHPSLPVTATTKRSVVKDALKKHKRLSPQSRASHLPIVQDALLAYIPYLLALNTASSYRDIGSEIINVDITTPLTVEWRATLTATLPGRDPPRPKLTGLHHEIAFVLSTLASTHALLARTHLKSLYDSSVLTPESRTNLTMTAMKQLLTAHGIHTYLLTTHTPAPSTTNPTPTPTTPDIHPQTLSALASLSLAEATLTATTKDDPHAAAAAALRNPADKSWMVSGPSLPAKRVHLFARICLAAAEHAREACALLAPHASALDAGLVKFAADLQRTARGKATRFLALDADAKGETGVALGWLRGARHELGMPASSASSAGDEGARSRLRGLKHALTEKREDRRAEKGGEWGLDAGRLEEGRVVEALEAKWERENAAVNVQVVAGWEGLLAGLPSGREYHAVVPWAVPELGPGELAGMRGAVGGQGGGGGWRGEEEDSGDEGGWGGEPVGAFPGTGEQYDGGRSNTSGSYY